MATRPECLLVVLSAFSAQAQVQGTNAQGQNTGCNPHGCAKAGTTGHRHIKCGIVSNGVGQVIEAPGLGVRIKDRLGQVVHLVGRSCI